MRLRVVLAFALLAAASAFGCSSSKDFEGVKNIVIQADPSDVRFTGVSPGSQDSRELHLTHVGDEGTLQLERLQIVQDCNEFFITDPDKTLLEPGEHTTLTVTYIPEANSLQQPATLRIDCNAINATGGVFEVALTPVIVQDNIRLFPSLVDFGEVPGGTYKDEVVLAKNEGGKPLTVGDIVIKGGSSPDFTIVDKPATMPTLAPEDSFSFTVRYTPVGGIEEDRADTGSLAVTWVKPESLEQAEATATLEGYEINANLIVIPGKVDFNKDNFQNDVQLEVGQAYERAIVIQNKGGYAATITDISLVQGPEIVFNLDQFTLEGYQAGATAVLEPGDKLELVLHFDPSEPWVPSSFPVARLAISSDDPHSPEIGVDVFARLTTPDIEVDPNDVVDFSFVAQNYTGEREVTIINAGQADLVVTAIEFPVNPTGEFGVVADQSFGPIAATPSPHAIAPDESVTFKVTFTNQGGATGSQFGTMRITSNDPVDPTVELSLQASRTDLPVCKLALVPAKANFGVVPHGQTKVMNMALKNIGSGNCTFKFAKINDCSGFMGLSTSCSAESTILSSYYKLTQMPPPAEDGLKPGGLVGLAVKYTPPATASLFDFEYYAALLSITYEEKYTSGDGSPTLHVFPDGCMGTGGGIGIPGTGTGSCTANLEGRSGTSRISVLPDQLDFGVITVGCYSQTMKVLIYSTGNAPLTLNNVYIDPGCPSIQEYKIKELPPLPTDVNPANPLAVKVVYHPQNVDNDMCNLIVESSDQSTPKLKIPMTGGGTLETEHTDEFTQISGQSVDILFVIDSSGSMSDERANVAANAQKLVAEAVQWDNDYQLGVIGTCIDTDPKCDNTGTLQQHGGGARIMRNNTTGFADTVKNVDKGGCAPDSQEAGLEAAHLALTLPRIHTTDIACTSDSQCTAPDKCMDIPGVTGATEKKVCGGPNAGFLREDAALEVIMISDEQDQSPATPAFYIDWFNSIKGFANQNLMHVHAIVGDPNGGCDGSSSDGGADSGSRYTEIQEATGGIFNSICDDDYATALKNIGNIAFGLKKQFFLTRQADPATVKVWVNDLECVSGWVYDQPSNSVIFDEYGTCMPEAGDEIRIWYKTVCYNS